MSAKPGVAPREFYQDGNMIWSSPPDLSFGATETPQVSAAPQEDCVIPANKELRIHFMNTAELCLLPSSKELRLDHADARTSATHEQANIVRRSNGELLMEATPTTINTTTVDCTELRFDTPHDIHLGCSHQDLVFSRPHETNTSSTFGPAGNPKTSPGGESGKSRNAAGFQGQQACVVRNAPPVRQDLKESAHIIHASWQDSGALPTQR
jgi:hypothetical protein